MGLDIYLYKVHKNPTMATTAFRIEEFPVLQKQFKDYIQIIDIELINWAKTFKCINEKNEDWHWTTTNTVGYGFTHNVKNRRIVIEHDNLILYIGTTTVLLVTEEVYQRKNVTEKYHQWLTEKTWEDEDGYCKYTNNIVCKQNDFVKAKEYYLLDKNMSGRVNNLRIMYDALKRKDTFIYNSW